jgi:hypothetical protein
MYTGSQQLDGYDYKKIDTFLIAYELGSMGECQFREALLEQIWKIYDVPNPSEGFIAQLDAAARKANKSIKDIFIDEAVAVLVKESDQIGSNMFATYVRSQLIKRLENFPHEINLNWVLNFSNDLKGLANWPGIGLTDKELELSNELIDAINNMIQDDLMSFKVVTKDLKSKQLYLLNLLEENV